MARGAFPIGCVAAVALMAALAGCGGDEEGGGTSAENRVAGFIERVIGADDPAYCTEAATLAFLEQTELAKGDAAIASCEAGARDQSDDPDSVEVSAVEVEDDTATADVAFEGGSFDGQTISVALIHQAGWKLDRIEDLIDFDPRHFGEQFAANPPEGLPGDKAQCVGGLFARAEPNELEGAILSGDPRRLAPYFAACAG